MTAGRAQPPYNSVPDGAIARGVGTCGPPPAQAGGGRGGTAGFDARSDVPPPPRAACQEARGARQWPSPATRAVCPARACVVLPPLTGRRGAGQAAAAVGFNGPKRRQSRAARRARGRAQPGAPWRRRPAIHSPVVPAIRRPSVHCPAARALQQSVPHRQHAMAGMHLVLPDVASVSFGLRSCVVPLTGRASDLAPIQPSKAVMCANASLAQKPASWATSTCSDEGTQRAALLADICRQAQRLLPNDLALIKCGATNRSHAPA